ncbi:uncharacterized protein LOC143956368 [Lithobates pipiens]
MPPTDRKFQVRGELGGSREETLLELAAEERGESCIGHMTNSRKMDGDQSHMGERILDLTLEIIYLLTGEDYKVVKKISGDPLAPSSRLHRTSPITVPPPHCLTEVTSAKKRNVEKILEVTKKMMDLLTGEVRRILGILGHYPVTDKGCVWMVTVSLCLSGSYKVSGCHCLFLHGGVGVFRRTQGSLQGRHDGESAAPHITG